MNIEQIFTHTLSVLDVSTRAAATARKPQVQTLGNEGSSPRADLGTAEVSVSQYRARIYEFERLIDRLYDLARADRFDELHDELRAEYRAIHGPSI